MKFLLKIVQGPNAGAEIALVEGVRVTLGSADACDIVLADPTLPAEACAIEASADGVVLTTPGAEPERLEPLRVRSFGSTALAVVKKTVGDLAKVPQKPVVIVSVDIRRYFRKMIEKDWYELPVLSFQELSPEINIQPLGRLKL